MELQVYYENYEESKKYLILLASSNSYSITYKKLESGESCNVDKKEDILMIYFKNGKKSLKEVHTLLGAYNYYEDNDIKLHHFGCTIYKTLEFRNLHFMCKLLEEKEN